MSEVKDTGEMWDNRELGASEEYAEAVEVDIKQAVEGEVLQMQQAEKLFGNLAACCDFVRMFGITNCNIRSGNTRDGRNVVVLQYQKVNH